MSKENNSNKGDVIKKGELLIVQGQEPTYMYYLHQGAVEILSAPDEFEGLSADIIISKSRRVGIIKEKSLISGLSILFTEPYKKSIRAIENSLVTKYPIKGGGFNNIVAENPSMATTILSHLYVRLESSINDSKRYSTLYQNLLRIVDNISLMYKSINIGALSEKLQHRADQLHAAYINSGGDFPTVFDARFLVADYSNLVKKKYTFPGLPMESLVDMKLCGFLNKFLRLDPGVFGPVIKRDPSIAVYLFETIADNLMKVLGRIEAIHTEIEEELSLLFASEGSWTSFLVDAGGLSSWGQSGRVSKDFLKNFLSMAVKIHTFFEEISGKKLSEVFPGFKKIHDFYLNNKEKAEPARPAAAPSRIDNRIYANSLQQIFEFSLIDKEFQGNFLKIMNDFKKMQNPFNTEPEGRKIRRLITRMYLDLYKQVFMRTKKEPAVPQRLMLMFGYIDETLMDPQQVNELHELSRKSTENTGFPIYLEEEFLTRIYNREENPSITEMGLSYDAHMREEEKHKKSSKGAPPTEEDETIRKVIYEIDHRLLNTLMVCSGSTATAFPILTSMTMKGNPTNFHISKKKLDSIVRGLREIDFSAFYRETVEKVGEHREIIQEEVIPNFILLPIFGTKSMLWQELDGTNRRTRGRIVVPILFMGDLQRSMSHTMACFRWELNRTLKGAMWADPVEGGLTGLYFDYINFYKKNPKLSVEAKEKISERFKSLRTNRDRFADDYIQWVLFEKDGIMKLNSVVREMFYRHIPFKKETRDKLENMPAFSEIGTKFKNVHSRDVTAFERKFKKYMDGEGKLPEALQKFMDFINT